MAPDILWQGMLIYIQEVFWIEDWGEDTLLSCTLRFSYFRTSFSFSLWLGEWDHFTRRTETFQKISNMYGYFLYILHCMDFSVNFRWWGEGGNGDCSRSIVRTVSTGCETPQCAASWMLLLYARDSSRWLLTPGPQFLSRGAQTFWHRASNQTPIPKQNPPRNLCKTLNVNLVCPNFKPI